MRWFASLVLALALGVMGCSETDGTGGSAGDGGSGGGGVGGDGGAAGVGGLGEPVLDQENLLDGLIGGQGIGRFSDVSGYPDPSGQSFDHQDSQSFTVGVAGTLRYIRVAVFNFGNSVADATDDVILELYRADESGLPDAKEALGGVVVPSTSIPKRSARDTPPDDWATADVTRLGVEVEVGDQLAFTVRTRDTAGYLYNPERPPGGTGDGYPGGVGGRRNAARTSDWTALEELSDDRAPVDFGFQTFVGPGSGGGSGGSGGIEGDVECRTVDGCDDKDGCTADVCTPSGECEHSPLTEGTACGDGNGMCVAGRCIGRFPCSEQGIRDAIEAGGGPHTFECDGPTTISTESEIVIDSSVILDGEGNLTLDGSEATTLVALVGIAPSVSVELRGIHIKNGARGLHNEAQLIVTGSSVTDNNGLGVRNVEWDMLLTDTLVSNNGKGGIRNEGGTVTILKGAVVSNGSDGIWNDGLGPNWLSIPGPGTLVVENSEVSGNEGAGLRNGSAGFLSALNVSVSGNVGERCDVGGGGYPYPRRERATNLGAGGQGGSGGSCTTASEISNDGMMTLRSSTIVGSDVMLGANVYNSESGTLTLVNAALTGACDGEIGSGGYNVESPGDTCGFNQPTDQADVSADDLKLGPLQDNGGPTMTHALGAGSVAIDVIPEAECVDADGAPLTTDQRGFPRDSMCDIGAFEVHP